MPKATIFFIYSQLCKLCKYYLGQPSKIKLERLYRYQKHTVRVIYHKDRYTHASPLLNDMKALNVFKLNIFNILCFMYKCKQNLNAPVFCNIFTHRKKKPNMRSEINILLKNLYVEQILVSIAFHAMDPNFEIK